MKNQSGTYRVQPGVGLVKVSEAIPSLARPVFAPKGDLPHYDPSARCRFESKKEKRRWLTRYGLREGGIIDPDTRLAGQWRNATKPSMESRKAREFSQAWIKRHGGAEGMLNRLQRGEGIYV